MRGESVGMVGKNGAGKTSILKCISGLWINKTGTISVYGKETKRNFRECISRMGVLIEYPSLFLDMTLKQNIEYFGAFCFADYHNEVLRLLELLNLEQSLKPSQQALLERLSAVLTDKDAETMREILKTFALSLQKIRRRKMKIKGKKVLQYMRRYGISVADKMSYYMVFCMIIAVAICYIGIVIFFAKDSRIKDNNK